MDAYDVQLLDSDQSQAATNLRSRACDKCHVLVNTIRIPSLDTGTHGCRKHSAT